METRTRTGLLVSIALGIALPALFFLIFGRTHLNPADEGYLWYGVLRTLQGEVPLRDFQAYDPGRYHWTALFAPLFGRGILGVRAAGAAFQALGLIAALLVARRSARHWGWQFLFAAVLVLWMFPRHKLFEPASAMLATWLGVRLLERPSTARHLAAGFSVGLAAYFGRNLALYSGLGLGALVLFAGWKGPRVGFARRAATWALGVVLGTAPLAGMLLFVPGFAASYLESLRLILEEGANLPQPWPWPWNIAADLPPWGVFRAWMEALGFLLPVLALPLLLFASLRTGAAELAQRSALVGSTFVGLAFLHHATVRSDTPHLAQCIAPTLLALFAAPGLFARRGGLAALLIWGGLALLTIGMALTSNPSFTNTFGREFVDLEVAGERLRILKGEADNLTAIEREVGRRVRDEPLLIAPNRPTLYCVLGKKAPTWWIYFFWKASAEEQERLIADLRAQGVDWALIYDRPTDGRPELLFRNTNDRVWSHFESAWRRVPTPGLDPEYLLFRRQ